MDLEKMSSLFSRIFFLGAFVLLVLAIAEKIFNLSGYTILRSYKPGQILEFSSILVIFVIALLLRQIREAMKSRS